MTDSVSAMVFRNDSFMRAFDKAYQAGEAQGTDPIVTFDGQTQFWKINDEEEKKMENPTGIMRCVGLIRSLWQRLVHWFKYRCVKSYRERFDKTVNLFEKGHERSLEVDKVDHVGKDKGIAVTPPPALSPSGVDTNLLSPSKPSLQGKLAMQEVPSEYAKNYAFIIGYEKGDLVVNGGLLQDASKEPLYDKALQENIVKAINDTFKNLDEEILATEPRNAEEALELFNKKSKVLDRLEAIKKELTKSKKGSLLGKKGEIVVTDLTINISKWKESQELDALMLHRRGLEFNEEGLLQKQTAYPPNMIDSIQQKIALCCKLKSDELDKEIAHKCKEKKDENTEIAKRRRLHIAILDLVSYTGSYGFSKLRDNLLNTFYTLYRKEIVTVIENHPVRGLADKIFKLCAGQPFEAKHIFIENDEFNQRDYSGTTVDLEQVAKWIQVQIDTLWTYYESEEFKNMRGFLLHMTKCLIKGLKIINIDQKAYPEFHKTIEQKIKNLEQMHLEKKTKLLEVSHHVLLNERASLLDILATGQDNYTFDEVNRSFIREFGDIITAQAFYYYFGTHIPKNLSGKILKLLFLRAKNQAAKQVYTWLFQAGALEVKGWSAAVT